MIWKLCKKSKLNGEKIWKIRKKSKLNNEKIWKMWKKDKSNSEMIWKIWKKSKVNSGMIWKIWKIYVLVIITPKRDLNIPHLLLLLRLPPSHFPLPPPPPPPPLSIHVYTLFFRIEKNHPGIVFLLETMQVGIKFTISFIWLLEIPQ